MIVGAGTWGSRHLGHHFHREHASTRGMRGDGQRECVCHSEGSVMNTKWGRSAAVATALVLGGTCGHAQPTPPASPPLPDRELVIAIREAPPFVMKNKDGSWRGISIDLWQRVADRLHLR